nr:hypothetical protein BaRGS_026427 [Batillaria attramentaria]
MGQLIRDHCSCQVPCMCGCQALAQNIFMRQRLHPDVMLCLLRQGKVHMAVQYGRSKGSLSDEVLLNLVKQCPSVQLVDTLLDYEGGKDGPLLPAGVVLTALKDSGNWTMGKGWLQKLMYGRCGTGV